MNKDSFIAHLKSEIPKHNKGRTPSPASIRMYMGAVRQFETFLNGRKPTKMLVKKFIKHIEETHQTNGRQPIFAGLRHYLRFLGWKPDEVKKLVPIPRAIETKTEDDIIKPEELQKLYNATNTKDMYDIVTNTMMKCLYNSQVRRDELRLLDLADLREDEGIVIVRNGKGMKGQPEEIPANQLFFDAVREYLKYRPKPKAGHENALFIQPKNLTRITYDSIRRFILTAQQKAGVRPDKPITPHWFRASSITHMHNNGADILHIQNISRHKSIDALKRYVRPSREQKREIVHKYMPTITETTIETPKQSQEQPQGMHVKPLEQTSIQPSQQVQVPRQDITLYLLKKIEELEAKLKQQDTSYMYG